ncbi:MAG: hypothetical protein LWW81_07725 [Rhodocyclales bacterium]|nr:hypothetical protein [Rhodocyclales bacterium]
MPLQNRVDPWGVFHAHPSKAATRMGNRGILHNNEKQIIRPWAHKGWVSCLTSFKNIRREEVFSEGNYSELFFLDEATAFSAGHRPCAYCQRDRSIAFRNAWLIANVTDPAQFDNFRMPQIDKVLHAERAVRGGGKVTYEAAIGELPTGTFFEYAGSCFLCSPRGILPWSFDGYGTPQTMNPDQQVRVLTPRSIVNTFKAGFVPQLHASAAA